MTTALCSAWAQPAAVSWQVGTVLTDEQVQAMGADKAFSVQPIPPEVRQRMVGRSMPRTGARINWADLRYLQLLHRTPAGHTKMGEMVVNRTIADEVCALFGELYRIGYPIERMELIDNFDADDERSMAANNTSAFCYRTVAGTRSLSKHARGLAIDLNPLYNPCLSVVFNTRGDSIGCRKVLPRAGAPYADRAKMFGQKITHSDAAYRLFRAHGFRWGGDWHTKKDYQHFEK